MMIFRFFGQGEGKPWQEVKMGRIFRDYLLAASFRASRAAS